MGNAARPCSKTGFRFSVSGIRVTHARDDAQFRDVLYERKCPLTFRCDRDHFDHALKSIEKLMRRIFVRVSEARRIERTASGRVEKRSFQVDTQDAGLNRTVTRDA
jgi:hypothetical protein